MVSPAMAAVKVQVKLEAPAWRLRLSTTPAEPMVLDSSDDDEPPPPVWGSDDRPIVDSQNVFGDLSHLSLDEIDDSAVVSADEEDDDNDIPARQTSSVPSQFAGMEGGHGQGPQDSTGGTWSEPNAAVNTIQRFDEAKKAMEKQVADALVLDGDEFTKRLAEFQSSTEVKEYEKCRDDDHVSMQPSEQQELAVESAEDDMWNGLEANSYRFKASGLEGNKIAGRWARAKLKDPKVKAGYAAVGKEREAQANFRAIWAEQEHTLCKDEKTKKTSKLQRWKKKGRYLSLGRIAWEEGNGASGWRAAINVALNAMVVGLPFIKLDGAAQNTKYLYFEHGYEEEFSIVYSWNQVWRKNVANGDGIADAGADLEAAKGKGGGKGDGKADKSKGKNKAAKGKGKGGSPLKAMSKATTSLNSAIQAAKKTKVSYNAVIVAAQSIQATVAKAGEDDVLYSECKLYGWRLPMGKALQELQATVQGKKFWQDIVSTNEIAEVKKGLTNTPAEFEVDLMEFSEQIEESIKALQAMINKLKRHLTAEVQPVIKQPAAKKRKV